MKKIQFIPLALAISCLGTSAWAAQPDQHPGHHPAGAASAAPSMQGKAGTDMTAMDTQTKAMRQMHDKVMAAKTPEERNALMAEHMKTMQDGMAMMNEMSPGGMSGMSGMPKDMATRHQMMEKHMEMMQSMMQMKMDRLPPVPSK